MGTVRECGGKLKSLIAEAEAALSDSADAKTEYNVNALRYMVDCAKAVLDGERLFPVSGSREYFHYDRETELQYLISHYVMYGFDRGEEPNECYGIQKALEWFRKGEADVIPGTAPEFAFEKGKEDYLLFSVEGWERLRAQIKNIRSKGVQYEKIKAIADRHSLGEIQRIWDATWNGKEIPESRDWYSDTAKGITLQAPVGAISAYLGFRNTSGDDEQTDFRIRNICFVTADGGDFEIEKDKGITLSRVHTTWQRKEPIAVQPGQMYTVHFLVNQRRKCKKGIEMFVRFCDGSGEYIEEYRYRYNRKAWYPFIGMLGLEAQCNAICYGVTKDEAYAGLAIKELLLFMDDFCQGATYWLLFNGRPEGRDSYGAVQAGRNLCMIAQTYAFLKKAAAWTLDLRRMFVKMSEFMLNDVFDLRDRTCLTMKRVQQGTGNWQTDMCIGAAMIAAAVEEIPYRKQWVMNAEAVLAAQLKQTLNRDGSWPESLRYHHAALEHFCTFAIFWENETGCEWRCKEALHGMFRYSIGVQMPPYRFYFDHICTPPFGDHRLSGGDEYQCLGLWIEQAAKADVQLASQMMETWGRAGFPVYSFGTERMAVENLMFAERELLQLPIPDCRYRMESRAFRDAGLYVFRKAEYGEVQSVLAVMANEKKIGHGHRDQGSFLFYYHNVPLVMDSGIKSYFDASTQWHISSYSHACLQFQAKSGIVEEDTSINLTAGGFSARKGWCDTPGTLTVLGVDMGRQKEGIRVMLKNPEGIGSHIRTIEFCNPEMVVIQDSIQDFKGEVLFSLPLLVKEATLSTRDGEVICRGLGFYGVNIEVRSQLPLKRAWIEEGSVTDMCPDAKEGSQQIPYLRMVADAEVGFQIALRAFEDSHL